MIRPYVLEVPASAQGLSGASKVRDQSLRSRDAAAMSAMRSGLATPDFQKDAAERPLPTGRVHWGVAHKATMVAGVCAEHPVAIDVERIRPRAADQIAAVLSPEEHDLVGGDTLTAYFCAWVAKEAVLKLTGLGLSALSRIQVIDAWSDGAKLVLDGRDYEVAFAFFGGHVAAVTAPRHRVRWEVVRAADEAACQIAP